MCSLYIDLTFFILVLLSIIIDALWNMTIDKRSLIIL